MASYRAGSAEGRDSLGRYFNYLSRDDLVSIYAQSGTWETLSLIEYQGSGYETAEIPWLAITVRKPG